MTSKVKPDLKKIAIRYCGEAADANTFIDKSVQTSLLDWYRVNRRMLPWRGDHTCVPRSSYGTWISEVMLQQTKVETVIEYWNRWMKTFPDVKTLASASPDDVNKLWAGLGYYRRAQMLLKGAIKVVEDYDGVLPTSTQELLKIPGIGPYTAGAIASIAYNQSEALVDGNVMRVFSRLLAMKLEVGGGAMEKRCWQIATDLVPAESPGDFNQALMELGATVCKPTSPNCDNCPLSGVCEARLLVDHAVAYDTATTKLTQNTLELFTKKRKGDGGQLISDIEDTAGIMAKDAFAEPLGYDVSLLPRNVALFPRKVAKKKAKELRFSVCVLRTTDSVDNSDQDENVSRLNPEFRYLFVRRPATGLLANQWEFPSLDVTSGNVEEERDDSENIEDVYVIDRCKMWEHFPSYLLNSLRLQWLPGTSQDSPTTHTGAKLESATDTSVTQLLQTQVKDTFEPILHIFSHQRHTMHVSLRDVNILPPEATAATTSAVQPSSSSLPPPPVTCKWMTAAEIVEAGITTGCKKILAVVINTANSTEASSIKSAGKTKANPKEKKPVASKTQTASPGVDGRNVKLEPNSDAEMPEPSPANAFELMRANAKTVVPPAKKRAKK